MRSWLPALLALALLPGCGDRDPGAGLSEPREGEPEWARRREVRPSTTVVAGQVVTPPRPLASAETALGSPLQGGRALFDGDPRSLGGSEASAVAVPPGGGERKVAYTAEARRPTLTVSEPPAPMKSAKGKGTTSGAKKETYPQEYGNRTPVDISRRDAPPKGSGACPAGMAKVEGFCIDRYEAGLIAVEGVLEMPWSPFQVPDPAKSYLAVSSPGRTPQGYISGVEAEKACRHAGKRLCAPAEWERACMGAAKASFPYGAAYEKGACNEHDRHAGWVSTIARVFGPDLKWDMTTMNDPRINQQDDGLAKAGAFPRCSTPEGVYDLVGNLHEWVADPAGTFRGGYYADTYRNGPGCRYKTTAHPLGYHDYSTGFRCCADPR